MLSREPEQFRKVSYSGAFLQTLRADTLALVSLYLFGFLIFLIIFGRIISPYPADQQFVGFEIMPPSWYKLGQIRHFFGTDDLGRDLFSRLLSGFYYTVGSALLVTLAIAAIGSFIGIAAGTKKRSYASILSHLFDTFLVTPTLLIAVIIAILMDASLVNAMLAIFLAMLPHFIHKMYILTQKELTREYVVTLRLDGASNWFLIKNVVASNLAIPAIKELSQIFVLTILDISALSFISLGANYPTPEWGAMIRDSLELIYIAPWTVLLPGIAIIVSIFVVRLCSNSIVRVLENYRY